MSSAAACRAAWGRKGRGSVTHMLRRRARLPGGDDSATVGRREGDAGLLLLNRSGVGGLLATTGGAEAAAAAETTVLEAPETGTTDFLFRMDIALEGKRFC